LLQQQVAVRLASIQLAYNLNMPLSVNLVPAESTVTEAALLDESLSINDLLGLTLTHRPELRQYEYLRLAAARQIQIAAAPLYPTIQWTVSYQHTSTSINPKGGGGTSGSNAGGLASAAGNAGNSGVFGGNFANGPAVGVTTAGVPTISGTPLLMPQVAPGTGNLNVTPGSSNTTFGTATGATTTGAGGSTVVTGGTGLLTPVVGGSGGGSFGGGGISSLGAFGGKLNTVAFGFSMNWQLGNLGTAAGFQIMQARVTARQALLQANQVLQQVGQQVRGSYLNALTAREQIDVTARGVASAAEELRLANLRVQMGVGTNLELIQAQRDYITALINQAQAIIASDQAQAQVLHDTGLISVDTLTRGYQRRIGSNRPSPTY
jgi:outer membrane protein TolC